MPDTKRILIIADNDELRRRYRSLAATCGFSVSEAVSGVEGMNLLAREGHLCVLMAPRLADMGGIECARSLRENRLFREIPVLMLTGLDENREFLKAAVAGDWDCYITDFDDPDYLRRMIARVVEKKRNRQITGRYHNFVETLIDAIPYPLFYTDEEGAIVGMNVAFERLMEMSGAEILGKKESDLFSLIDEAGDGCTTEWCFRSIRGGTGDMLCNRAVFTQPDGSMAGSLCVMADITGIKGTERELRTFRRAVEQSPASIVITDREGVILYVNPTFTEVTGYAAVEVSGKKPNIVKSGTHPPEFYRQMWETILSGRNWVGEFNNRKKNGELFWELASISPILDERGEITHLVAIKEDITEKKQMEEDLKDSEEKLKVLFESLVEGIAVTDLEGKVLQVNTAFVSQHRYAFSGDMINAALADIIPIKNRGALMTGMGDARRLGQSDVIDFRIPGPGVSEIDEEMTIAILKDRDYHPWGYVITTRDVSERKRTERALRESEERNREILEAIPDLMFRIDAEGNFRDPVLEPKAKKVFPPEIMKIALPIARDALESGEIKVHEYPVYSDGVLTYYEARFIVSGMDEVLVILRNISDRITAEEQLKKARDDAEAANRAKSEFLANMSHEIRTPLNSVLGFIELLQRTELKPVQSEYLGIVSSSAANLLGIINDILDYSKIESGKMEVDQVPFDPVKEFESVINLFNVKAGQKDISLLTYIDPRLPLRVLGDPLRIKQVLNNLLSNAIKFTPEHGSIRLVIREEERGGGRCRIHFSVDDDGIGIDKNKQKKIFEAFTQADSSMARKYGGTGLGLSISANLLRLMGSSLELSSEKGKGSDFYFTIEFAVEDAAHRYYDHESDRPVLVDFLQVRGAAAKLEEFLQRYMETFRFTVRPFERPDELAGAKGDLALSVYDPDRGETWYRNLCGRLRSPLVLVAQEKHRGEIERLKPCVAQVVFMPVNPSKLYDAVVDTVALPVPEAGSRAAGGEERLQARYRARVLVAEDNAVNQKLIRLMLEEFGAAADIARNGLEAIEKYERERYDLVFLDINMPVYDGLEAAKMILEFETRETLAHVPLVALTAKAMKGDRESLLASGFDDYLSKPLSLEALGGVLERYLQGLKETGPAPVKGEINAAPAGASYDLGKTATILGIPPSTLKEIIGEFFASAGDYVDAITGAVASGDVKRITDAAHRLKGLAANLQFTGLAALCESMETGARNDYKVMLDEIENTIIMLDGELKPMLER